MSKINCVIELQYSLTYYWYYLPIHKIQTFQYGTVNLHVTMTKAQTHTQKDTSRLNKQATILGEVKLSKAEPALIERQGLASLFYRKENGKCSPVQWRRCKWRRTVRVEVVAYI